MPIFHEKKTIFSHNPKAGGTSVLDAVGFNKSNEFNPMNVFGYISTDNKNLDQKEYFDRHEAIPLYYEPSGAKIAHYFGFMKPMNNVLAQHLTKFETVNLFERCYGNGTLTGYDSFTIIRNPYDRWISSLAMVGLFSLNSIDVLVNELSRHITVMNTQWDFRLEVPHTHEINVNYTLLNHPHVRPQHAWAEGVDNIFTLDNADILLSRYLKEKDLICKDTKLERSNVEKSQEYTDLKRRLLDLFPGRYDDFIKEFYAKDIQLYEETLEKEKQLMSFQDD